MSKSDTPVIELSNLTIRRDGTTILRGVNWRVNRGEHWVVLGGNGSGKTTLLSALSGYFMPSNGEIDLLGKRFGHAHWPTLRQRIGIVSSSVRQMMAREEPALSTVVTGKYGMIDLWGHPTPADRAEAGKLLQRIGCAHLAARPWAVLSQGEQQRILIGRALMARPGVLLLDEPCAGLDPAAREAFLQSVDKLARRRASPAMVLVTHHVEEITPVFSHVLLLRDGGVVAGGAKLNVMKTELMAETFGQKVSLKKNRGRYRLEMQGGDCWTGR
ncbi:MAG: ABC transporter ATP-binding protein [Verrucomicrobia bacterium]|nr:ABC transporter ATP-binding protein [Verrucomicrobiota bacterium]